MQIVLLLLLLLLHALLLHVLLLHVLLHLMMLKLGRHAEIHPLVVLLLRLMRLMPLLHGLLLLLLLLLLSVAHLHLPMSFCHVLLWVHHYTSCGRVSRVDTPTSLRRTRSAILSEEEVQRILHLIRNELCASGTPL
jgi:hypothetical protein